MGQKVMPTGFRLGITEDWRSRWYSDKDYAKNLANDMEIRKFLDKYLAKAAVAKVEIERAGDKVKVIITTARPGVVIGKKGSEIEQLRKELAKIVGGPVNIEVIEVKRPELDANLVAQSIAEQLLSLIHISRCLRCSCCGAFAACHSTWPTSLRYCALRLRMRRRSPRPFTRASLTWESAAARRWAAR